MFGGTLMEPGLLTLKKPENTYQNQIKEIIDQGLANQIHSIKFNETEIPLESDFFIHLFNIFPNLKELSFWGINNINIKDLPKKYLNKIENVNVYSGNFPVEVLKSIAKSKNLKEFSHGYNLGVGENNEDIIPLINHPSLENIYLIGDYTSKIFPILSKIPNLKEVDIESPKPNFTQQEILDFFNFYQKNNPDFKLSVVFRDEFYEYP